jgi:CubicO group peptidase (beta-lactamase class C family)
VSGSAASQFAAARAVLEQAAAARVFPAAAIEVGTSTRPIWQFTLGRLTYDPSAPPATADTVFDLASLTKVLATTPLVMRQVERGALGLDDLVATHVPSWRGADRGGVTIRDLLAHCSGLPPHRPLYLEHRGTAAYEEAIGILPLEYTPRAQALYSDLDFILLGAILERLAPLPQQFDALRAQMRIAGDLQFNPPAAWIPRTAPARYSDVRQRVLIGEVDDDNAWALGGAAGHAGLFGTADAVGECARHVVQVLGGRTGAFGRDLLRTFIARRTDVPGSSRALGWDTMLTSSSCGTRMSPAAFGHTGFTGTSLWIDPDRDVYVVLLTNRVHPQPGDAAAIRQVRRDVHDAVMSELTEQR